ncbi:MAG: GntR family transcriptional regulator [Gemmatimonadetes bacterium]|nr:GntR family transcriptional regulator [Gemmatimonadota bacterium]
MTSSKPKSGHLVETVSQSTRAQILDGTYPPGAPLRLNRLAEENEVSLIPVREALRLLESERFVISEINKGARVAPLSMQSLEDLYRVRTLVEVEALRLATDFMDPEFINSLDATITEAVRKLEANEIEKGLILHRAFHDSIYALSGSEWLCHMIEVLWAHSDRYIHLASLQQNFVCSVDDHHHAIIDCLLNKDVEGAAKSLARDLQGTVELLRDELGQADLQQAV